MKLIFRGFFTFFVLIALLTAEKSYSQDIEFKRTGNWEYLYEIEGVNFYYIVSSCNDEANGYFREHILLRLENTNDYEIVAQWDIKMYYNGICFNCGEKLTAEHHRSVVIPANDKVEGRCFSHGDKTLTIFSRFLNDDDSASTLTKFELVNLTISLR